MAAASAVVLLTLLASVAAKYYLGEIGSNMQIRSRLYTSDRPRPVIKGLTRVFFANESMQFVANGVAYSLQTGGPSEMVVPKPIDVSISMSGSFKISELNSKGGAVANYTVKLGGQSSARLLVVNDVVFAIHEGELYAMDRNNMKVFGNIILAQRIPAFGAKVIDITASSNNAALAETLLIATNHAKGGDIWRLTRGTETFEPACVQPDENQLDMVEKLVNKFENEVLKNSVSEDAAVSEYTDTEAYELKKQTENLQDELSTLLEENTRIQYLIRNVTFDKDSTMRSKRDTSSMKACINKKDADPIFKELDKINEVLNNTVTQMMEDIEKLLGILKEKPTIDARLGESQ